MEPISQYYYSHRLKLHFWDWGDNGKPNLILVHGGMDHARSWDRIAQAFCSEFRVVAPDLRGHGDSSWAPGAMYSIPEYVLDVSALVDIVGQLPVYMAGHSLGGIIVLHYAGIYPDRVAKLVSIEGYGSPPEELVPRFAHQRLRKWIEDVREHEKRSPRKYPNVGAAVERMKEANPYLSKAMAQHLTLFGSNWNPDGTLMWKFDNYVRTISPIGLNMDEAEDFWRQITSPTLLLHGVDSWMPDPEPAGRIQAIPHYRLVRVPEAGHWVHHDQPEIFIEETRRFFNDHGQAAHP